MKNHPPNDEAGVRAVVDAFEAAWNRHDMNAMAMLFAVDADFVNIFGVRWIGRETIKQAHIAAHATVFKTSTLTTGDTTIRFLNPDVATARSVWSLAGITAEKGQMAAVRTGILSHVLVRTDEHWLITMSQNTDIAAPPGG